MKDNKVRYTVITGNGCWGKGDTPIEAAKNANIRATLVFGNLYKSDPYLTKGEIECSGDGSAEWTWSDEFYSLIKDNRQLRSRASRMLKISSGKMKISKGELIIQTTV
jgi:hypothetical protein